MPNNDKNGNFSGKITSRTIKRRENGGKGEEKEGKKEKLKQK